MARAVVLSRSVSKIQVGRGCMKTQTLFLKVESASQFWRYRTQGTRNISVLRGHSREYNSQELRPGAFSHSPGHKRKSWSLRATPAFRLLPDMRQRDGPKR